MRLIDIISTASSNMFRAKLRTSLTVIAIFIGAFTLTLTNGLGSGISNYINKQLGDLGAKDILIIQPHDNNSSASSSQPETYDPNRKTTNIASQGNRSVLVLTDADVTKIRAVQGIKSADAYRSASIDYVVGPSKTKYVATTDTYLSGENFSLDAGKLPDNTAGAYQVTIPQDYANSLGFKNSADAIGKSLNLAVTNGNGVQTEVASTIVGVEQNSLLVTGTVEANSTLINKLIETQDIGLPAAATATFEVVTARFDDTLPAAQITDLKNRLKDAGYTAQTVQDKIGTFKTVINAIVGVLDGFAVIALLAASFGIINTLLMSVQERTKEIGLMKAMGMSAGRIFLLFSGEAVMLGLWGSLLGSAVAIGIGTVASRIITTKFLSDLTGLTLLSFSPASVGTIVGIVMLISFLAGTLPAIRAARQNPIDSLRYE